MEKKKREKQIFQGVEEKERPVFRKRHPNLASMGLQLVADRTEMKISRVAMGYII